MADPGGVGGGGGRGLGKERRSLPIVIFARSRQ